MEGEYKEVKEIVEDHIKKEITGEALVFQYGPALIIFPKNWKLKDLMNHLSNLKKRAE